MYSGITISLPDQRIRLWADTLRELGDPEYCHLLFDPDTTRFVVQVCGIDDEGAKRLRETKKNSRCIYSLDLIRYIYSVCAWDSRYTYRTTGVPYPSERLVEFMLSEGEPVIMEKE